MTSEHLKTRISFFSKISEAILRVAATILIVVQIIKTFEEGWTPSILQTLFVGAIIFWFSQKKYVSKSIKHAISHPRQTQIILFVFGFLITAFFLYLKITWGHESRSWQRLNSEGGLPEYGTSLAYLLAGIFAFPVAKSFAKNKQPVHSFIYYAFAGLFLFICLEEISWGQRLLNYETPQFFLENNAQSELTFHNLDFFQENLLHTSYITVGAIGSFSWIVLAVNALFSKSPQPKSWRQYLIPWYLSPFFIQTMIFYIIHEYTYGFGFFIVKDQESVEFILSLGFLVWISINSLRQAMQFDENEAQLTSEIISI